MRKSDRAVGYIGYVSSFELALKIEGLRPHTVSCYVREAKRLLVHCYHQAFRCRPSLSWVWM
jgi:hypothetical protein